MEATDVDFSTVEATVVAVAAWYGQEIGAEREKESPDYARVGTLVMRWRAATRTLRDLVVMGPEELAATGKKYGDLLLVLNQQTLTE